MDKITPKSDQAIRKGRPTADDSREMLAHILAVAQEMFCAHGYRAVTMRAVAEKAQVSTRTLYNRYADKLSLFTACMDFGSGTFPHPSPRPGETAYATLSRYAAAIARSLSTDTSLRLGLLISREGGEFPELLRAGDESRKRNLVQPLTTYLQSLGVENAEAKALLFISMALSDWMLRVTYRHPLPAGDEFERHATMVADIFLRGCGLAG